MLPSHQHRLSQKNDCLYLDYCVLEIFHTMLLQILYHMPN